MSAIIYNLANDAGVLLQGNLDLEYASTASLLYHIHYTSSLHEAVIFSTLCTEITGLSLI
jgi:hypothetical protein